MMDRYKATVCSNGESIQEMFDFSMQELKERLRLRIQQLDRCFEYFTAHSSCVVDQSTDCIRS